MYVLKISPGPSYRGDEWTACGVDESKVISRSVVLVPLPSPAAAKPAPNLDADSDSDDDIACGVVAPDLSAIFNKRGQPSQQTSTPVQVQQPLPLYRCPTFRISPSTCVPDRTTA